MTYTKPEVAVLGEAIRVIEQINVKNGLTHDAVPMLAKINPAYDMDE